LLFSASRCIVVARFSSVSGEKSVRARSFFSRELMMKMLMEKIDA